MDSSRELARGVAGALAAGAAAERARRRELGDMTDAEARAAAEVVLALLEDLPPQETSTTGLAEQQRLFARLRA